MLDEDPSPGLPAIIADATGRALVTPGYAEAFERALGYAADEKAKRTRAEYGKAFASFRAWCAEHGAPALPSDAETVVSYLSAMAKAEGRGIEEKGLKAATLSLHLAAIAFAHRVNKVPSPTKDELVVQVVRGIRRHHGTAQDQKAPATAEVVRRLIKRCPPTLVGKRDAALIAIGFAAALRRSELVALRVEDIERRPDGIVLRVRKSKTDQEGQGQEIPVPYGAKVKPIHALDAWLSAAKITSGPLFRPVGKGGKVGAVALHTRYVSEIIKKYATEIGLNRKFFSGHSLRAGFVTSALETGADVMKIMDISRHRKIETLKKYDRRANMFKQHAGKGFL